jgi:hypothetical protein
MAFEQVRPQVNFPKLEGEILKLWEKTGAFEKSVERRPRDNPFVFYEGPPTANGRPGFHHALARAFKDLIPRYKTMRGYRVERKGGWDCHGLPVELQVEKELGLSGKTDVERYGVEEFNRLCRESVFRYVEEWREMSARLGFWVDMENAYWTLDNTYMESVWWALKSLYDKDLLYEGYKITAHCPRDQTSLSSAEVAMGYETVTDPSVYVKLPLVDDPETKLLIWTTTPLDHRLEHRCSRGARSRVRDRRGKRRAPDPGARANREGPGRRRPSGARRDKRSRPRRHEIPPPLRLRPRRGLGEPIYRSPRRLRDHDRGHRSRPHRPGVRRGRRAYG